jgi:hypothetical protein
MTYQEACALVDKEKAVSNYLYISLGYSCKIILPYKEGIAFIAALQSAEQMADNYSKPNIGPFALDSLNITVLSAHNYRLYKMAGLLDLSFDEVKEMAKPKAVEAA